MLKVFFKTLGCQMNVSDSSMVENLLRERGYLPSETVKDADLVIVNTCSVRERAETRAKALLNEYAAIKKKRAQLWVVGCMAQRLGRKLIEEIPSIDRVIGAKDLEYIASDIDTFLAKRMESPINTESYKSEPSVFLPVMRGCDNYCAYCIVPYVRGHEHSISKNEILEKTRKLVDGGTCEISLLGQNVNSYHDNDSDFADLLYALNEIDGLKRIRFTTSHPKDISGKLIQTISDLPKVCNHIHLPVQSGSSSVLNNMNRKYTRGHYLEKIEKIKTILPDIDITTDVMVGFPGETDDDFQETLSLFREVRYTTAFMFAFSIRTGTKAATMSDQVPNEIKKERLNTLIKLQTEITKDHYQAMVGKTVEVLFTLQQERRDRGWLGQDFGCKRVLLSCTDPVAGMIFKVNIIRSSGMTLIGERI